MAKKYFPGLFGNEKTKAHIGAALENGTPAHAYIINGAEGTGRHTLARNIAQAVNCERRGDALYPLPCGRCDSCRRIRESNFTDVKTVRRAEGRATTGVDDIRAMREDITLSATESDRKIYIIEDAHTLTPQAQNALLKYLEEPPTACMILLLTNGLGNLLVTIKSRAQIFSMERFPPDALAGYLTDNLPAARDAERQNRERFWDIVMSADGCIGAAVRMLDPRSAAEVEEARALTRRILACCAARTPYSAIYEAVYSLPQKRAELNEALESALSALRDVIVLRRAEDAPMTFFPSAEEAGRAAEGISLKRALTAYEVILSACEENRKNANISSLLAVLAARLKFS